MINCRLFCTPALGAGLIAAACVSSPEPTQLQQGRSLVQANCSACHAVGEDGDSPAPEAPPFRRLSENYRVSTLEDALSKGISTGHPAMPEFRLSPKDVKSVMAYLQSVQARGPS